MVHVDLFMGGRYHHAHFGLNLEDTIRTNIEIVLQLASVVLKNAFHVPRYVASSNILRNVTKLVPFVNLWNVTQRNDKFWPKFSFQYVTNSYRIFKEFLSIHTWMFNICVTVEKFCVKGW